MAYSGRLEAKNRVAASRGGVRTWRRSSCSTVLISRCISSETRFSSIRCTTATMLRENTPLTRMVIRTNAIRIRRAKGCLDGIGRLRQAIADAMQGMQQRCGEGFIQHLTQLMDMAAQAVAVRAVIAPERFFQRFAADYGGALLHQHSQEFQPDGVELERLAGATDVQGIEGLKEIAHLQLALTAALAAPQDGLDTRHQFGEGKGLDQIIVSTGLQALQAVIQGIAGGQHEYRHVILAIFAQTLAQLITVNAWQHDVQHDQVIVTGTGQVQTAQTILGTVSGKPLELQVVEDVGQDVAVVFDD